MNSISTFLCTECGTKFGQYKSQLKNPDRPFCSKRCWYDYKSKHKITWNKGLVGVMKPNSGSFKRGVSASPSTQFKKGDKVGSKNNLWKGGIYPLHKILRQTEKYFNWRSDVFKRDNYSCMKCGIRGVQLNADHIKPFSKIYKEFLEHYPQFSPIDDKETLVRLASRYEDFYYIENGVTLCVPCHKKTPTYLNRNASIWNIA